MTIRADVERVADAAGEIALGNNDLSNRTEQQAASLDETAASMEELTATVKHNATNAREASDLAKVVTETAVLGPDEARLLAGTTNELKDGSGQIAEITTIIKAIAFQTNILALNAAVEARPRRRARSWLRCSGKRGSRPCATLGHGCKGE